MLKLLLTVLFIALLAPAAALAQSATFAPFDADFTPRGLSTDGATIVGVVRSGSAETGYVESGAIWRAGSVTLLDVPANVTFYPQALSDDGTVIVGTAFGEGSGLPAIWADGTVTLLSTFRGNANDVSPDGTVTVGTTEGPDSEFGEAYRWENGSLNGLGVPSDGEFPYSYGLRLSADRSTVLGIDGWSVPDGTGCGGPSYQDAFVYRGAKSRLPHVLTGPEGNEPCWAVPNSIVQGISGDGSIVVGSDHVYIREGPQGNVGLVWENGTPSPLPLPAGTDIAEPSAISDRGARIAGSAHEIGGVWVAIGNYVAVVWDDGVPRRLSAILEDAGIQLESWILNRVIAMSGDGRVLIGSGRSGNGKSRTWRVVLPATAAWSDPIAGFFDDEARWAPALVPDSLTAVRFDAASASSYTVTLRQDHGVRTLIADSTSVNFALDGHALTVGSGDASSLADALIVGNRADAQLELSGGSLDVLGSAVLGRTADARGIVTLTDGHALSIDGPLMVGDGGTDAVGSAILVLDGTVAANLGVVVGFGQGTSGLIKLFSGTSLQVPIESTSTIGGSGFGLLNVDGAFVSHTGQVVLGAFANGRGRIELADNASMLTTDSLRIGLRGAGELSVASGSGLTTGPVVLGELEGSVGSVQLTGVGSRWDIVGDIVVGDEGAAVLEVVDQAFICLGGFSRVGPQGRVVTDATIRIERQTNCAATTRESQRVAASGLLVSRLSVDDGGEVVAEAIEVGEGGVVDGAGTLAIPVTNGGTLAPGGDGALGALALSAPFTQTADGTLSIEIGASSSDVLSVDGSAALGGTLRVAALPGEAPTVGQSYDVLTADAITGAFDQIEAPDGLVVTVSATAVTVSVFGTVVGEDDPTRAFALHAPAPNPARGSVELSFDLVQAGTVRLSLHDVLGREVAVLADGFLHAGVHDALLAADVLAPGVYIVRLLAGDRIAARRLTVAR